MKKINFTIVLLLVCMATFAQNLDRGYRGFAEAGFAKGGLKDATVLGAQNVNRLNISTVHGYQFNPRLYLGGGFVNHFYTEGHYAVALFANIRVDILQKAKTPFVDFRGGHCYGDFADDLDLEDGYLAFSAGYRFNHCNFSIGWEASPMEYPKSETGKLPDAKTAKIVANALMIKFAFDWGARQ